MIEGRFIAQLPRMAGAAYARAPDAVAAVVAQPATTDTRSQSTAAVQVVPMRQQEATPTPPRHMSAAFIAHLIATDGNFPQTRERRRAEPTDAALAYVEAARLVRRRWY